MLFAQVAAAAEVIENFENLSSVEAKGGKLVPVTEGPGVTEGKQAAEMPAGTTITLSLDRRKLRTADWIKIDTLNTRPVPVCIRLAISGQKYGFSRYVYVKPGTDTLALPLTVCWDRHEIPEGPKLELATQADAGVIVDNLRMEGAVPPPEGAGLEDYGDGPRNVWPGFENRRNGINIDLERFELREFSCETPDPLTGDFVGRGLDNGRPFRFSMETKDESVIWLWVTHYGRDRTQSTSYAIKTGKELLVKARYSGKSAGVYALAFGRDFDWTTKNFESQYISRVVDLVKVKVAPGQVFDVKGCQIAAAVYGPAKKEAKLAEYVNMVQEDLVRYRRQFVLGTNGETFCTVAPDDAESAAGMMVFLPQPDESYSSTWAGDEKCRAGEISAVAANGGMTTVAVAVVPLRKTKSIQAQLIGFKTEDGKTLIGGKSNANVIFLERVPCVRNAKAVFQPWIAVASHGPVEPCRLVWMAIQFVPSENAKSGLYKGTIKLTCTDGERTLPVSLKVVYVGQAPPKNAFAVDSTDDGSPEVLYGAVYDGMSASQRSMLTAKIRDLLIDGCLTGLMVQGASLDKNLKIDDSACVRDLKLYPSKRVGRGMIFSLSGALWQLNNKHTDPDKNEYKEAMKAVVGRTYALAAKTGVQKPLMYIGFCWKADALQDFSDAALAVAEAKGRAAIGIQASVLNETGEARLRRLFKPISTVFVRPDNNSDDAHKKYAILKDIGCEVYAYLGSNDRYHVGFYSSSLGFDGVCLENLFSRCSPYDGLRLRGSGLLVPDFDGAIRPTLAMLRIQQGTYDFQLVKRAEELVQKADKAKIPSAGVKSVLDDISKQARDIGWLNFDESVFRTTSVSEKDVESLRVRLTEAAGALAEKLGAR